MTPSRRHHLDLTRSLIRHNVALFKQLHADASKMACRTLCELTRSLGLSVASGEICIVNGKWYVTHAGLLKIATRRRCRGIQTALQEQQSDPLTNRWVFKAVIFKNANSRGFVGYGDADPSNISPLVRGAEMRIAETRAVNRALRKAYGIGLCSVEELGWVSRPPDPDPQHQPKPFTVGSNGHNNGQPRLRDQLCLLIRQYNLDPNLVKAYAADFCGTQTVKEASRELVESFISHLAASAKEDRDGLICKLNSYSQPVKVKS